MAMFDDIKTPKFKKEDDLYLSKRKEFAEEIGKPDLWSVIDQFGLYAGTQTLASKLAVFEILKKTVGVAGHVFEFGCWHGSNLMFMAKVLQLLEPHTFKKVYGFDSFEGLQTFSKPDAGTESLKGKYKGNLETLQSAIRFFGYENWVHPVIGDARKTIPEFAKAFPHAMVSFAYIDFDLYEPCKTALDFIAKRLSPGGIVAFDEALVDAWPGEGQAMLEFIEESGQGRFDLHNATYARQPTAYLVKK